MKLLALETSTEILSIALGEADADGQLRLVASHDGPGGAQSSATLLPTITQLLAQADWRLAALSAIVFGAGPGSFTGLRTACSVAQGLALGADLPVLPIDTLMAVAEHAWAQVATDRDIRPPTVLAAMDARMGEVYFGFYTRQPSQPPAWAHANVQLGAPEDIGPIHPPLLLAGNARHVHATRLPPELMALPHVDCLPSAAALLRLAPARLAAGCAVAPEMAIPRYVRDKVAKTTAERLAERAAAVAIPPLR